MTYDPNRAEAEAIAREDVAESVGIERPEPTIELRVPGAVYGEVFDPRATGVPGEYGWPDADRSIRRGKFGSTVVYDEVPIRVVREMLAHARDWGEGLSFGADPESMRSARRVVRWVDETRAKLDAELDRRERNV